MKVKVVIAFTDKHTGKKYKAGEVIDVTAKRFNEITAKGKFIQPVEEAAEKK